MENNVLIYTDNYGDEIEVKPVLNMYVDNNNLYLGLESYDEELEGWDSYCDVTVNIFKLPFLESALDLTCSGVEKVSFLVNNGFGQLTGQVLASGFCTYPVFRFDADKLMEIDSQAFIAYATANGIDIDVHSSLDEQIKAAQKEGDECVDSDTSGELDKFLKDELDGRSSLDKDSER